MMMMKDIEMVNPTSGEYAAIYARRSTKLENHSIDSQIALAKDVLIENKLLLYDTYSDKESATKFHPLHRPGFKKLMYDAMQGKFKTVVVFRRDRLARRVDDLIDIKNTFKKYGIRIIYSNKGEFQADPNIYISNFVENIIMSVDELEPSILAERIASGKKEKRERGEYVCGGKHLYGFNRIDKNGKTYYALMPEEANIIKKIYEKFLEIDETNHNYDTFIDEINALSSPKKFELKEIFNIILKPVYGKKLILRERDDNGHKIYTKDLLIKNSKSNTYTIDMSQLKTCINVADLINETAWCNAILKWRKITPERTIIPEDEGNYFFKNLLKCGICKKNIFLSNRCYICSKFHINIKGDDLVDYLLENFLDDILTSENIDDYYSLKMKTLDSEIKVYEKEITALREKQNEIVVSIIQDFSPTNKSIIDNSDLKTHIENEKKKQEAISTLKSTAITIKVAIDKLKDITHINHKTVLINMLKKNIDTTQYFLTSIIEEVNISEDGTSKIRYKHDAKESCSLP
jgi:site-specific DNA recombinase